MRYINPLFAAIFFLCAMGLWGCNQQKTGMIGTKLRDLENRHAKLEEDFHTLQATYEQNRKRLSQAESHRAALEKEKADLTKQLDTAIRDRENLRTQVSQRTQERDYAQSSLMQFSKDLQALAGRVEAALNSEPPGTNAAIIPASRRNE